MNLFSLALFISAGIAGAVAYMAYRRREVQGGVWLLGLMTSATWWSALYGIEMLQPDLAWHKFWSSLVFLAIAFSPLFWLYFAIDYTSKGFFKQFSWLQQGLFIFPIFTSLMVLTNPWHGWMWTKAEMALIGQQMVQIVHPNWYFWIHIAFSYLCLCIGIWLFARYAINMPDTYRAQSTSVLLALFTVILGNGLTVFNLLPFPGLDITPFTFTIAGMFLAWGLLRQGLLEVAHLTAETMLNALGDAVLATDAGGRALYANPAFHRLAGLQTGEVYNQPVTGLLPGWPEEIFVLSRGVVTEETHFSLPNGQALHLEIQHSPIFEAETLRGQIYTFHVLPEPVEAPLAAAAALPSRRNLPISLLFNAADGKILDLNTEFTYLSGYTREESLGKSALQLGLWDAETRANLLRVLYEKSSLSDYTLYIRRKDGSSAAWQVSITVTSLSGETYHLWQARPLLNGQ